MTANEFKAFLSPLTYIDAAKLLGVSKRYIRMMADGLRPVNAAPLNRQDVLHFLRTSPDAAKSRQQLRNQVSYKEYIKLIGLGKYKCRCCCYPATETIYNVALCEICVKKITKNKELKR